MNEAELVQVILTELKAVCEENAIEGVVLDRDTVLFGDDSLIDSMALVGLIIKLEEHIQQATGREIQVIDDEAIIADGQTPFRTPARLAAHALAKVHAG
jgi:acyl carrier protein